MTPLLILGVGNPWLGDDGLGPRAIEALERSGGLPPEARLLDGGTRGLALLPEIEDAGRVIVIDAIDVGAAPGTIVRLEGADAQKALGRSVSAHDVGLRDVLWIALLRGTFPEDLVLFGVQVAALEAGADLSPEVAAALPAVVSHVRSEARRPRKAAPAA